MVNITKEAEEISRELSKSTNRRIKEIIEKITSPEKKKVYVRDKTEIKRLLRKAFNEKRKVITLGQTR